MKSTTTPEHIGVEPLVQEFVDQSISPPGNEPAIGAFCAAAAERAESDPQFRQILSDTLQRRQPDGGSTNTSEIAGVLRSSVVFHTDLLNPFFGYKKTVDSSQWAKHIDAMTETYYDRSSVYGLNASKLKGLLFNRNVSTSVPTRLLPAELTMQALRSRFQGNARVLDIGASVGLSKWLLQKDSYAMEFNVVTAQGEDVTTPANQKLGATAIAKELVCVDTEKILNKQGTDYSTTALRWFLASMRPSERRDPQSMGLNRELLSDPSPHVTHITGNLLEPDFVEQFIDREPEPFDVVMINTMIHQLQPAQQQVLLRTASSMLAEQGMLLVQDFAYCDSTRIKSFKTYANWHASPYRYATYGLDNARPEKGLLELMRLSDSRCREATISDSELVVGDALVPFSELVVRAND